MKIENTTNKEGFLKALENGTFEIETIEIQDSGKIVYKITDNRLNAVSWYLHRFENNYAIEYKGIDAFTVYCVMNGNEIEIDNAIQNGKNYRAKNFLKNIVMFAYLRIALLILAYVISK